MNHRANDAPRSVRPIMPPAPLRAMFSVASSAPSIHIPLNFRSASLAHVMCSGQTAMKRLI